MTYLLRRTGGAWL
ncbi:Protein of unknown function [Propionibacterium freudenreichii]|nr:Protein of unknown function [Propionibacterium freudenreichii]